MLIKSRLQGFTLIEILIVIALIAILAGAVIIAINPTRQFAAARNSERIAHLNSIMRLIQQKTVENKGIWSCPGKSLPTTTSAIESGGAAGTFDICDCLVPTYAEVLPIDPSASSSTYTDCTNYNTAYTIMQETSTGRIILTAPEAELGETVRMVQ